MKILCVALLLAVSTCATAATVYLDRVIPVGQPCMIKFAGRDINATMISDVAVDTWTVFDPRDTRAERNGYVYSSSGDAC